ncbi:MAG TPA: glycosyltransferase family 39 protein, partial [Acidimicrobiales bacterium]|nr:glycosyltransferase family 39 protein [Acidimicrobiales bacterium]
MQPGQRSETSAPPTVALGPENAGSGFVVVEQVRQRPAAWRVATVVAVALGVVLRFVSRSHLWLDEALSVSIAELPLGSIAEALRHDGAPPLYYLLLHGWMELFGTSPMAVRALSGIFAVAAIPLVWVAGRRLGGPKVAVTAALLMAASPFAIQYGTEARMYSLVVLLTLAGWLAFDDLLRRFSWSRAVVLALASGLLLLTHYWAFYLLAVAAVVVVRRAWRGPNRAEARRAALAMAAGSTLFLPWVPS